MTVFGSSRSREGEPDYEDARALGSAPADAGFAVCSGGYGGVMASVSRGAKERGHTRQERLSELIRLAYGLVACKGGTGTLVELSVVWEMLDKSVIQPKPFAVLDNFWEPIIERVREVELAPKAPWDEADRRLIHEAGTAAEVASYLTDKLK